MKHIAEFLRTALEQLIGKHWSHTVLELLTAKRRSRIWRAYTYTGKVVVIDGDRVVKVIDTYKQKRRYRE